MATTFRNSKITYYGPHECPQCGVLICKMGQDWGGNAFTYPRGPVYPNTEWHVHVCDPYAIAQRNAVLAEKKIKSLFPTAVALKSTLQGWLITADDATLSNTAQTHSSSAAAWISAYAVQFPDEAGQA